MNAKPNPEDPGNARPLTAPRDMVYVEQVNLLYTNARVGLVATLVNPLIVAYVERQVIRPSVLLTWLACTAALALVRFLSTRRYLRAPVPPEEAGRWATTFIVGVGLSGVLWGSAAVFLFPSGSLAHQCFLAFVLGGMVAGAVGAFSVVPKALAAFSLPVLVPIAWRFFAEGGELQRAMGTMVTLYAFLMAIIAARVHAYTLTSLRLRLENAGLVTVLRAEKERAETTNEELAREIVQRTKAEGELKANQENLTKLVAERTAGLTAAYEDLSRAKTEWESTFDVVPDLIAITDPDGRIQRLNRAMANRLGVDPSEAIGRYCFEAFHGLDAPPPDCPHARLVAEAKTQTGEMQLEDLHFLVSASPLPDAHGVLRGAVVVARDITGLKRVEQALSEAKEAADAANRAKGDFLARMSHEIRTPMNGIMGMTELALLEPTLPPRAREFLSLAKQSARGLLEIINDILDIARIEAGRIELEERPFDLAESVRNVLAPLRLAAEAKRMRLTDRLAEDLPALVLGDEGRLRQVLTNLAGNAIKFSERGEVEVTVRSSGEPAPEGRMRFLFAVRDGGIGIRPENLGTIFDTFSAATRSTHAQYGGTGLGLSIARQLVGQMGGKIWVESEVGRGSRFLFTAEFGVCEAERAPETPEPVQPSAPREQLRVLLAEDNLPNQVFAEELLHRLGHTTVLAADGEEALRALSKESFDVVLMDVQMPVLNGDEATRRIRAGLVRGCPRDVPVIALTAHALEGDRDRFLAAGMDDYLSKPFDPDTMEDALWRAVALKRGAPAASSGRATSSAGSLGGRGGGPDHSRVAGGKLPECSGMPGDRESDGRAELHSVAPAQHRTEGQGGCRAQAEGLAVATSRSKRRHRRRHFGAMRSVTFGPS